MTESESIGKSALLERGLLVLFVDFALKMVSLLEFQAVLVDAGFCGFTAVGANAIVFTDHFMRRSGPLSSAIVNVSQILDMLLAPRICSSFDMPSLEAMNVGRFSRYR